MQTSTEKQSIIDTKNSNTDSVTNVIVDINYDINKLAYAIAMAETHNCEKWYWLSYNNCFGIKNWNTAPCPKIWKSNMCIYDTPEQSYEAFKKIWGTWYKSYPNWTLANRWTWWDRVQTWLNSVSYYYN